MLELVGRSAPPHRPVEGLLADWYTASGTAVTFGEWCDPAARHLADVFEREGHLADIEQAVVAFAQARAGADHCAPDVAADLVALVRLAWPSAGHEWDGWIDPLGLLARALGAWAAERVAVASSVDCTDPVTGLVTARFLERRLHELHAQCDALAISPPATFGSVVVRLELSAVAESEGMGVRVAAGRILASRFRAGETVAVLSSSRSTSRMAAVMPAYGIDRAMTDVRSALADLTRAGVSVSVGRTPFADDASATFATLVGTR
ncbi:MAG: hypothetical protein ACRDZN_04470 [Acidimicrobiales bacterium]